MFEKILVPLDGSGAAECILPYVATIAAGTGAELVLARVAVAGTSPDSYRSYMDGVTVLAERQQRIKQSLENAEKIKQELAKAESKAREVMVQAGQEASKLIEEARAAAAKVQEQETQKAIAAAQAIVDKARQAAQAEHARMLADLRREVGRLVVDTTAKVTGKVLTLDDQKRLAEETSRELAA